MPAAPAPPRGWSLAGRVATTTAGARLDLDAPGRGLCLPEGGTVLGVALRTACHVGDHWLRGDDLIAVYEPADARRVRATALWRPFAAGAGITAWELTLSAQTSLLQSDPALAVTADLACARLRWSDAGGSWREAAGGEGVPPEATSLLVRTAARPAAPTVLVAVHPADARQFVLRRTPDRIAAAWWLFSSAIEKGVLLRGRALAAVGPAAADETWATALLATFATAPPPLTS